MVDVHFRYHLDFFEVFGHPPSFDLGVSIRLLMLLLQAHGHGSSCGILPNVVLAV
jgi:hypothetical protein